MCSAHFSFTVSAYYFSIMASFSFYLVFLTNVLHPPHASLYSLYTCFQPSICEASHDSIVTLLYA